MTIEVTITNKDQSENPEKVAIVRTYHDKGNSVDDGVILQPGESHTAYVHDESFVQVDETTNPNYAAPALEPEPEAPTDSRTDDDDTEDLSRFYGETADGTVMFDPNADAPESVQNGTADDEPTEKWLDPDGLYTDALDEDNDEEADDESDGIDALLS